MKIQISTLKNLVKKRKAKYMGCFDVFQDNSFQGWVYNKRNIDEIVTVEIYHNDTFILRGKSNLSREDLKLKKIGNGKHGFNIAIDENTLSRLTKIGGKFYVYVDNKTFLLGEVGIENIEDVFWTGTQIDFINDLIKPIWTKSLLEFKDNQSKILQDRTNIEWEDSLFNRANKFPYLMFSSHRFKVLSQSKFEVSKAEYDDLIQWYVVDLQKNRFPIKIPVSKELIDYLTKPIEIYKIKNSISRHAMHYLHQNRSRFGDWDLNNDAWYLQFIFSYCENVIERGLGDFLIPEYFINKLRRVGPQWKGHDFPISRYMEFYFSKAVNLHIVDLGDKSSVILYVIYFLGLAIDRPELLKFVPKKTLENVFRYSKNENVINSCFLLMYGESTLKNYISKDLFSYQDYDTILHIHGFSLNLLKSNAITENGNRLHYSNIETERNLDKYDVQVIGPFEKASGLGQACRLTASIIENTKFKLTKYNFDLDNPAPVGYNDVEDDFEKLYSGVPINLIHLNAESIPTAYAYLPDIYSDSYNIGYFYWELDTPASCHFLALDLLDEVWVATDYGVSIYQSSFNNDVVNVGMIAEDIPKTEKNVSRVFLKSILDIPDDTFVFLTIFDSFSFIQRKNPLGVIKAFQSAFENNENVSLILKTQNRDSVFDPVQVNMWDDINELTQDDNRIHIINETFTYKNLLVFKQACDCYVSLHKSEGWGFGMIESMQLGLPVICTNYSGNLDFCNDENVLLVDYEDEYLNTDDYIFVRPGQVWANPKINSASEAMMRMYQDPELRKHLSLNAENFVANNFSMEQISHRFENRLSFIFKNKIVS